MNPLPQGSDAAQAQAQLICHGCRTLLVYSQGASNVRCALCSQITSVSPTGAEMAQLLCGGCRTLLMYIRGATSVQCSCCNTVNLAMQSNQIAHINCGGCGITLMYAYGAQSVKCAVCNYVSGVTGGSNPASNPAGSGGTVNRPQQHTVVVENPPTIDDQGNVVSCVAVGVTSGTGKGKQ